MKKRLPPNPPPVGRMFAGEGARIMASLEKGMQNIIRDWGTKFLINSTNAWMREFKRTGTIPKAPVAKAAKMVGTLDELKKVLLGWSLRAYQKNYKRTTGSVAVGPEFEQVISQLTYRTGQAAEATYTDLQAEFYNSTRKFMGKLEAHNAKHGVPLSVSYVSRQLRGLPGASPYNRAGAPEPPSYRFKGKKLRTFGTNGINGSRDPFQVAARARVIARTELTQARNDAQLMGFKATGRKYGMWVAFNNDQTRRTHKELDGKIVEIGQPFEWNSPGYGQVSAMAPGDASLPAGERINCRCSLVAATEKQFLRQEGRL